MSTVSTHTYTAKIVGTSTVVPVTGGTLDLDSGSWPHVSGSVEIPLPSDFSPELIPNGDFSNGLAGWSYSGTSSEFALAAVDDGPTGRPASVLSLTPGSADRGIRPQGFAINHTGYQYVPGATYRFKLVTRVVSGNAGSIRVRLGFHGDGLSNQWPVVDGTNYQATSPNGQWVTLEGTHTAPVGDPRTAMSISVHMSNAVGSVFEVAELSAFIVNTAAADFLNALDPRTGARLEITASAEHAGGTTSRVFNLGVRERPLRLSDGTLRVELASDEALLDDYRTLAEDDQPYWNASSLRSVCNYVIGKAIPGKSLAAQPNTNANVSPFWEAENLIVNPRAATTTGWAVAANAGTGTLSIYTGSKPPEMAGAANTTAAQYLFTVANTSWADIRWSGGISVNAGTMYHASGYMAHNAGTLTYRDGRVHIDWLNVDGQVISTTSGPTRSLAASVNNTFRSTDRPYAAGIAPVGAVSARVLFRVSGGLPVNGWMRVTGALFVEGARQLPYFDGANATDAGYTYSWQGTANSSTSLRVPIVERDPESLVWQAGQSAMDFLMPIVQSVGLRLVCDETRTWTLRDENYTAPGLVDIRYGVNMIDADDTISRNSDTWFDGMVCTYRWTAPNGTAQKRIDAFALSANPTRVVSLERETAYPGKGLAEYAVRRAQGRGREVSGVMVSDWSARPEQSVQIILPSQLPQTGITERVRFDLDRDRVEVTARTRDTPTGAIDLLSGTIDGLTGNIDSL